MTHRWPRIVISLGALGALLAYLFAPEILGDSLADRLDSTALGLLALAALPWLALLVSEFEAFGMKAKMAETQEKADKAAETAREAKAAAAEARRAAAEASAAADQASDAATEARAVAEDRAQAEALTGAGETPDMYKDVLAKPFAAKPAKAAEPEDIGVLETETLLALAGNYVDTRRGQPPGPDRTAAMTAIFTRMQRAAQALGPRHPEIAAWLGDADAGKQLAAIAYLRSFPDSLPPSRLVEAIGAAGEPFVQYWALRALSGRVDKLGIEGVSIADRERLKSYESRIRRGTDRHSQLTMLNKKLDRLA